MDFGVLLKQKMVEILVRVGAHGSSAGSSILDCFTYQIDLSPMRRERIQASPVSFAWGVLDPMSFSGCATNS